jgi:hypothetical protein
MQSFAASTRNTFLKYTLRKRTETVTSATQTNLHLEPSESTSILKSDKILEQLSQGLPPLPYGAGNRNKDRSDQHTETLASGMNVVVGAPEDDRAVREHFLAINVYAVIMLRSLVQAPTINSNTIHPLDDSCPDQLTLAPAPAQFSGSRAMLCARKHEALHKIRRWEVDLNAAKDKVLECVEALQVLREEVEEAENSLALIESGPIDMEQRILRAKIHDSEPMGGSTDDGGFLSFTPN